MKATSPKPGELDFRLTHKGREVVSQGQMVHLNRLNPDQPSPQRFQLCPGASLLLGTMKNVLREEYRFHVDKPQFNISFCLSGQSSIRFADSNIQSERIIHSPSTCTVSYLEKASGFWRPSVDICAMATLNIDPHAFKNIWKRFGNNLPKKLRPLLKERNPEQFFFSLPMSPSIQGVLGSLMQSPVTGPGEKLMLECKTMEMLVRLTSLLTAVKRPANNIALSSGDMERIHAARRILEAQLENPPTLPGLARLTGINEFKLKRGFRQVFGTTPFGHLRTVRLEKARRYLETGKMNVYESCLAVGYSSLSNFISLFKREFGITPGKVLQCAMRTDSVRQKQT